MGSILHRQGNTDFSGLQFFSGMACLLGACVIAAATYLLGNLRQNRKDLIRPGYADINESIEPVSL
ncbi:hypothetical protein BDV32DRAFT_117305 [Aspergillus pseudonomiae]|nr:hypothetical protein BDV32DRAFT_117305 [Aspergillus pseudonomiae]